MHLLEKLVCIEWFYAHQILIKYYKKCRIMHLFQKVVCIEWFHAHQFLTCISRHLLTTKEISNNNSSLMKFQKQSNPNNGRAIHFICMVITFILEQLHPDGSNSSNTEQIPRIYRMKEAKSWRSRVNMILKTEDLSWLIRKTEKSNKNALIK